MSGIFDPFLGVVRDDSTTAPAMTAALTRATAAQRADFTNQAFGYVENFAAMQAISAPVAGMRVVVVAPVIAGGLGYTRWVYHGAIWRPDGPQDLLLDFSPSAGVTGTTEQILKQFTLPAGLLSALRYMRVYASFGKSGTTDAMAQARLRMGSAGTTSDAQVISSTTLSAAARQYAMDSYGFAASATQWRLLYNGSAGLGSGGTSAAPYPQNVTISPVSGVLRLSLCAQMAGSTDTPLVTHVILSGG